MARTKEDLAYVAGLFDGEGSVQIAHRAKRPNHYALRIVLANADEPVIRWLCSEWGGSVFHKKFPPTANHRDSFQWQLASKQALIFLDEIGPYLRIKHKHAAIGMECQLLSKRWGGGNAVGHVGKPPQVTARQVLLHAELARLNYRGRRGAATSAGVPPGGP